MQLADTGGDHHGLVSILARLARLHPKRIDLGLDRIIGLLGKLGNPHLRLPPLIHIAGTNGKGSVLAFLRAMLEADGAVVHAYTSPHLVRFNERIRLRGKLIADDMLAHVLAETEAANDGASITFFEITTAAAMLAFAGTAADYLLLEVGLGGRMDATNVIPPPLAACITPIAHDHEHFLGNDLAAIAGEKAGIIKHGVPVISAKQPPAAAAVIKQRAEDMAAPLLRLGEEVAVEMASDGGGMTVSMPSSAKPAAALPSPTMIGQHQRDNACLAAASLLAIKPDIAHASLSRGATAAAWPGRIQHLSHGRLVSGADPLWLDSAHNGHGAKALAASLQSIHAGKWLLVAGVLNTRPMADFLTPLAQHLSHMVAIPIPDQAASVPAAELASAARGLGIAASTGKNIRHALTVAQAAADTPDQPIIIGGSVYLAGHVLAENGTLPE